MLTVAADKLPKNIRETAAKVAKVVAQGLVDPPDELPAEAARALARALGRQPNTTEVEYLHLAVRGCVRLTRG
jgi:DNA-binding transcriptional regulator YhcF (GntR family)